MIKYGNGVVVKHKYHADFGMVFAKSKIRTIEYYRKYNDTACSLSNFCF